MKRHSGTIITYLERGFGFISRASHPDLFFHIVDSPAIQESQLQPGAAVTFDVVLGDRGPRAVCLEVAA